LTLWLLKQNSAHSASGKYIQERVLDTLLRTVDHSCISQREPETSVFGTFPDNHSKLKAQRLRWTTAWRRLHKKIKVSDGGKQKKQRALKIERAIEGVTLESIKKMKTARPEDKKALAE
jgi:hypothetical protein